MDDLDDTDAGLAGLSPEFQAMVGGLEGHTAMFAKMLEKRSAAASKKKAAQKDDEVYFESYADLAIHEDMLRDGPRCTAYIDAIRRHGEDWAKEQAVVVDVGAGTGLLSILAARAGAKQVHAVEASRLAHFLPKVVADNALTGRVVIQSCLAEELDLGEGTQVDVVVSEWMGYFLLYENMLPSVLAVRDRYLRKGGLMLPSRCRLLLAPLQDDAFRSSKIDFWKAVHGVDMSALIPIAVATASEQPRHVCVAEGGLLADGAAILELDLHTATATDLESFEAELQFNLPAGRRMDGFASWFDCEFGQAGWLLSTHPGKAETHWRQTAFYMREPLETGGGVALTGRIKVQRHEVYTRGYRITFDLTAPGRKSRLESFELR